MRLITVAIHTCERAIELKNLLEGEGIPVVLQNVNLETPVISSGMRVRIPESDLPLALRIIENTEIFKANEAEGTSKNHPILVPVDFSEYSLKAVCVAFGIANMHGDDIVLLHSYIDPYIGSNAQLSDALTFDLTAESEERRQIEQTAKTQMSHFSKRIRQLIKEGTIPPVKFSTLIVEGVPEDIIEDYSKTTAPYMIVMGTRGVERKTSEMIGSVAAEVLVKCRVTVLSVPEPFDIGKGYKPQNVLFVSNLDQGDILALDTTNRIFEHTQANVFVVDAMGKRRIYDRNTKANIKGLLNYCQNTFPRFKFTEAGVMIEKDLTGLLNFIKEKKIDLIVIPNKRRKTLLGRLFNPGLVQRLIMSADLPMLVIRV